MHFHPFDVSNCTTHKQAQVMVCTALQLHNLFIPLYFTIKKKIASICSYQYKRIMPTVTKNNPLSEREAGSKIKWIIVPRGEEAVIITKHRCYSSSRLINNKNDYLKKSLLWGGRDHDWHYRCVVLCWWWWRLLLSSSKEKKKTLLGGRHGWGCYGGRCLSYLVLS